MRLDGGWTGGWAGRLDGGEVVRLGSGTAAWGPAEDPVRYLAGFWLRVGEQGLLGRVVEQLARAVAVQDDWTVTTGPTGPVQDDWTAAERAAMETMRARDARLGA